MNELTVSPASNEMMVSTKSMPSEHEMMVYATMAKQAVDSKMYRGIGDQAGVMMIMLAARELGIPPMQALNGGLNIIQGKVEISARMMSALIRRAGHHISIKESTDRSCTLVGRRSDTGEMQSASYTIEEAQKAGLIKNGGGWTKCPKDMCFARAMSRLARQLFSDVIGIGYVEGEIKAVEATVVLPDDIPLEDPIDPEEEATLQHQLIEMFEDDDKYLIQEYLRTVMNHYGWDKVKALREFLKDPKALMEKFIAWKNKRKT